ncbi:hypothetical protein TMEN_6772 [Trichophyton mentagrophytes]|nr:hypothetical protein TMEN_6772 [Trichophyton mentagrophytes]
MLSQETTQFGNDSGNSSGNSSNDLPMPPKIIFSPLDTIAAAKYISTIPSESYLQVLGVRHDATPEVMGVTSKRLDAILDDPDGILSQYKEDLRTAHNRKRAAITQAQKKHRTLSTVLNNVGVTAEFQYPIGLKHRAAHQAAHPGLYALYRGFADKDIAKMDTTRSEIDAQNTKIRELNKLAFLSPSFATINVDAFKTAWKGDTPPESFETFISNCQLPKGWAKQPPQEEYIYDVDTDGKFWLPEWETLTPYIQKLIAAYSLGDTELEAAKTQLTLQVNKYTVPKLMTKNMTHNYIAYSHLIDASVLIEVYDQLCTPGKSRESEDYKAKEEKIFALFDVAGYPSSWLPQQGECLPTDSPLNDKVKIEDAPAPQASAPQVPAPQAPAPQAPAPQAPAPQVAAQSSPGKKRRIAIPPRPVVRHIRPGYTTTGEKILYVGKTGFTARLVVEDNAGQKSLITSSEAGGMPIVEAAIEANIPLIRSTPLKELRSKVTEMGEHGIDWVAIGKWNVFDTRNPFMVCKFFYHDQGERRTEAVYCSNLKTLFGPGVVDKWFAEAIYPNTNTTEEALEQLYGVTHEARVKYWEDHPKPRGRGRR